jgi:UDP-2,4-diacetamido-2,4,6-trideoxy-beta-L-altropyranose hydrolase
MSMTSTDACRRSARILLLVCQPSDSPIERGAWYVWDGFCPSRETGGMTRNCVLFRVDGTKAQGWESFSRCLTFAYALQRRRRPCHFLARLEPSLLGTLVKRGENQWLSAEAPVGTSEDLEDITREIRRLRPSAVIVDDPHCSPEYLAEFIALGPLVLCLDGEASYRFPSQMVVHPQLHKSASDYDVCPGSQVLAGPRYAVVRPGIRRIRPIRGQEPPEPFRAVVALGDDPGNWTSRCVKALMAVKLLNRIDILARPGHPKLKQWEELAEANKGSVTVATETLDQSRRISRCHFAVAEADTGALELACVGVPMLLVVQNELFWPTAQRLEEEGAANLLGWHEAVKESSIRMAAENLLKDAGERRMMARAGRALIDGRGPDRLVTALEIMLHPSRTVDLDLREAA